MHQTFDLLITANDDLPSVREGAPFNRNIEGKLND
jgi:hypothetical protein